MGLEYGDCIIDESVFEYDGLFLYDFHSVLTIDCINLAARNVPLQNTAARSTSQIA